jgi:hypothetical protein
MHHSLTLPQLFALVVQKSMNGRGEECTMECGEEEEDQLPAITPIIKTESL